MVALVLRSTKRSPLEHTDLDGNFTSLDTELTKKAYSNNPFFTGTVYGVTKVMVGLGNVDNTSDANKPISDATQTALNAKANTGSANTFTAQQSFTGTTAASPAITGAGDPNTGVFFPAADTVAVSTGGAERMRIDANGNVGIGGTPVYHYKFQVSTGNLCLHSDVGHLYIESAARVNRWWLAANINDTVNDGLYFGQGGNGIATGIKVLKIFNDTLHVNPAGGLGYGTGAGGTVTQATSKSTAVTLNKPCGRITTHNEDLAAGASVLFAVNNTVVGETDCILFSTVGTTNYRVEQSFAGSGQFGIRLTNLSGGSLSNAVVINFAIIKGALS